MANNYVETAFNVPVTPEEASLLEECFLVAEKLSADFEGTPSGEMEVLHSLYAACSDAFRNTFPKQDHEDDPVASFLELWVDSDIPSFDADITIDDKRDDTGLVAFIRGHEVDVQALASLIQKVCKSALPFGFEWASTCDKFRPGQHGGGYFVITGTQILGTSTREMMDETLRSVRPGAGT
jgi:hypothetical protein